MQEDSADISVSSLDSVKMPYSNFFKIEVKKCDCDFFIIHADYENLFYWKIQRSYEDVQRLHKVLVSSPDKLKDGFVFPDCPDNSIEAIENYLRSLIYNFSDSLWEDPTLVRFFDDKAFESISSSIIVKLTKQKIDAVESFSEELYRKFKESEALSISLFDAIEILQKRLSTVEHAVLNNNNIQSVDTVLSSRNYEIHKGNEINSNDFYNLDQFKSSMTHDFDRTVSPEIFTNDSAVLEDYENLAVEINGNPLNSSTQGQRDGEQPINPDHQMMDNYWSNNDSINNLFYNNDTDPKLLVNFNQAIPFMNNDANIDTDNTIAATGPTSIEELQKVILPLHMIPRNTSQSACDEAIEEILSIIKPHDAQLAYRSSAKSFLSKQIRKLLGVKVYEIGLESLGCFLPDDPIKLSVILWRNYTGHWHTHLSDRLCRLSENAGNDDEPISNDVGILDEIPTHMEHNIFNVSYTNDSTYLNLFRIYCMIDSLGVVISSNNRSELCLLAFYEEVAILVGKHNLFKRSLLLIRAWWVYETATYLGTPMKHYLSDEIVTLMLCSIFNRYHDIIHQPFQALCMFLTEYASVNWSESVVTLQGVVPFKVETDFNNQPQIPTHIEPKNLLQLPVLEKYWDIVNLISNDTQPIPETSSEPNNSISSTYEDSTVGTDVLDSIIQKEILSEDKSLSTVNVTNTVDVKPINQTSSQFLYEKIITSRMESIQTFERRAINVLNPFTYQNMMNDKCNLRRSKRLSKALCLASKDLYDIIKLSHATGTNVNNLVNLSLKSFLRNALTRFENGWRPDVIGNTIWVKSGNKNSKFPINWNESHWQDPNVAKRLSSGSIGSGSTGTRNNSLKMPVPTDFKKSKNEHNDNDSEASDYTRELMCISLDRLWDEIFYCSLVLEGKLTESALLMLTKDILIERGTLPVGEIGKMLQELIALSSLSSKLKEKFGGLKKFLERFSEYFVIGSDHPFNPHVYYRQMLTAEDFEIIARGSIPPLLLAKFKKVTVVKQKIMNKKQLSASIPSQSLPPPPPPQQINHQLHQLEQNNGWNSQQQNTGIPMQQHLNASSREIPTRDSRRMSVGISKRQEIISQLDTKHILSGFSAVPASNNNNDLLSSLNSMNLLSPSNSSKGQSLPTLSYEDLLQESLLSNNSRNSLLDSINNSSQPRNHSLPELNHSLLSGISDSIVSNQDNLLFEKSNARQFQHQQSSNLQDQKYKSNDLTRQTSQQNYSDWNILSSQQSGMNSRSNSTMSKRNMYPDQSQFNMTDNFNNLDTNLPAPRFDQHHHQMQNSQNQSFDYFKNQSSNMSQRLNSNGNNQFKQQYPQSQLHQQQNLQQQQKSVSNNRNFLPSW